MPLTFLAHQAPVLPIKLRWPGRVDGTALVIGSMAPDLLFALHGTPLEVDGHTVAAQLWLCLPLTVVLTVITKRVVAGVVGPHLPDLGPLHLQDYGRLSAWRVPRSVRGWIVVLLSALIGSFSHLVLDSFTHSWGFVAEHVGLLNIEVYRLPGRAPDGLAGRMLYTHDILQVVGSLLGIGVTLWCLVLIGRRRLLVSGYPTYAARIPTPTSRRRLVGATGAGALLGLVAALAGETDFGTGHDLVLLTFDLAFVGLAIGSLAAAPAMSDAPSAPGPAPTSEPEPVPVA